MQRRDFLKLSIAAATSALLPNYTMANELSNVEFNAATFDKKHQTIVIFLNGGPSALSGNLSNIDEINESSQQDYFSHFRSNYLSNIDGYDLWKEAGGESMKNMLDNKEMTLIRTCYSPERERVSNRAHGLCTMQNMRGHFDINKAGIMTTLSRVMENNNKYNPTKLPFMTLAGESHFFAGNPNSGVKPVSLDYKLRNPFELSMSSSLFYSRAEKEDTDYNNNLPALNALFDAQAKSTNTNTSMNDFLTNKEVLAAKIKGVADERDDGNGNDKNIATYGYINDRFHQTLATSIELLDSSDTTRTITIGTGSLGGWDDHSFCKVSYTRRMQNLFQALEAGMRHLDGINKKNKISIIVYGEFGRNVNLNNSFGWDHGNLQNLYILGGTDYFNHVGGKKAIIGETVVDNAGKPKSGRVWLKPKTGSYECDPLSVASTIYAIHGITNPEVLTGGYGIVNPKVNGEDFIKT